MFKLREINAKGKSVLLIGDTHLPYEHQDYRKFCLAVKERFGCELVIHMGDYEDNHAISFHDSDCELFSAGYELQKVIAKTKGWYETFPNMITLDSNHGSLVIRRMKKHGIPIAHLKTLGEIYETPDWQWVDDLFLKTDIGRVYLTHGKTGTYNKLAREIGCHAIQGHFHGKCEVTWANSVFNQRYNMFTGCGVDRGSLAMAYGKNNIPQPILACGVLSKHGYPRNILMNLNAKGRWDGKLP